VTNIADDADHAVTHEAMAAGIASRSGTYRALCNTIATPPAMTEPSRHRCPYCAAIFRTRRY
jgi:hypothetical protein